MLEEQRYNNESNKTIEDICCLLEIFIEEFDKELKWREKKIHELKHCYIIDLSTYKILYQLSEEYLLLKKEKQYLSNILLEMKKSLNNEPKNYIQKGSTPLPLKNEDESVFYKSISSYYGNLIHYLRTIPIYPEKKLDDILEQKPQIFKQKLDITMNKNKTFSDFSDLKQTIDKELFGYLNVAKSKLNKNYTDLFFNSIPISQSQLNSENFEVTNIKIDNDIEEINSLIKAVNAFYEFLCENSKNNFNEAYNLLFKMFYYEASEKRNSFIKKYSSKPPKGFER